MPKDSHLGENSNGTLCCAGCTHLLLFSVIIIPTGNVLDFAFGKIIAVKKKLKKHKNICTYKDSSLF